MNILDFRKENSSFGKSVVWALMFFFFLLISIGSIAQDKVKFTAAGVTCSLCSNAIHGSLKNDKSILKIEPNLETQEWNLEYKTGEFNFENLKKRVSDAGFSVSKVWLKEQLIFDMNKLKRRGGK